MKNIKKFLIVTFAFLTVLTFTGCEKKNEQSKYEQSKLKPEEALIKAQEAAKEVENYKLSVNMFVGVKASYEDTSLNMDMSINYSGKYDEVNKTSFMNMNVEVLGIKESSNMYAKYDETKKELTTYVEEGNKWTKTVVPYTEYTNKALSIDDLIAEGFDVKETKADKNNYNYEITISADTLKKIMSTTDADESTTEILNGIVDDIKIIYSLDKETYQISKLYMNLTDTLNKLNLEGVEYTKVEFEVLVSDYNNAGSVTIPEEVTKNAVLGIENNI